MATLLVDARNGFNELSRKAAMWTLRHLWPNGSRFAFNCYKHASILVLRNRGKASEFILSREGVTQGDPISMVVYGLALVPLAKSIRSAVPNLIQPWYADDVALSGRCSDIAKAMDLLNKYGPARGYYGEPQKSVIVCSELTTPTAQSLLEKFKFQYCNGHRYLGGFIGSEARKQQWLQPQIAKWCNGVELLAKVARRFPQTAYAGLSKSLQAEWQYLQRVCPNLSKVFGPVEDAISQVFLPSLLNTSTEMITPLRELTTLPVSSAGLGLPDPTQSAEFNFKASVGITKTLSQSLSLNTELGAEDFHKTSANIRSMFKKEKANADEEKFSSICSTLDATSVRRLTRCKDTGSWLTLFPNSLNGTDLAPDEFRDSLLLRFGITPPSLPDKCSGCCAPFSVDHAMSCKKGGLIMLRHNDLKHEWTMLCAEALPRRAITDEPLIHTSQDVQAAGDEGTLPLPEIRGDIGVHGFWRPGNTTIFDIRVTDTDATSQINKDPNKILQQHEKMKKDKYYDICQARNRHFTPLVFSIDGLRGQEANAACKRLAALISKKWSRPYSEVCGYVRSRIAIALVRSASNCLRADRDPIHRWATTEMIQCSGLGLYA